MWGGLRRQWGDVRYRFGGQYSVISDQGALSCWRRIFSLLLSVMDPSTSLRMMIRGRRGSRRACLPLVLVMRLWRISIRRYRATLLQGSTHVRPELQSVLTLSIKFLTSFDLVQDEGRGGCGGSGATDY